MQNAVSDDDIRLAIGQHTQPGGRVNLTAVARDLGVARTTLRCRIGDFNRGGLNDKDAAARGILGTEPVMPGYEITSEAAHYGPDGELKNEWIKQVKRDEAFEIPEGHVVKGVSAFVDPHGKTIAKWIKTREGLPTADVIEALTAELECVRGKSELIAAPLDWDEDLLTVYPIADAHLGLLAWGKETGTAYDLNTALGTISTTMAELVEAAPKSRTAIVLNLGDFTHANDATAATPASKHQLDVDGRFPKTARAAIRIARQMIELALSKHGRVIYRGLPGNHDPDVAHLISLALEMFFENNPRVSVDISPDDFFHFQFGEVMLAGNHGHKIKADEMPGIMASYWPTVWGATKFRYAYSAHYHQIKTGEKHGASWEIFRSPAAKDSYSHNHGFGSGRSLVAITYHKNRGEKTRTTASI